MVLLTALSKSSFGRIVCIKSERIFLFNEIVLCHVINSQFSRNLQEHNAHTQFTTPTKQIETKTEIDYFWEDIMGDMVIRACASMPFFQTLNKNIYNNGMHVGDHILQQVEIVDMCSNSEPLTRETTPQQ